MLQVGDLTIYQEHGICRIDEICDKTYGGKTRKYYVLHPIENNQELTINLPVENRKVSLLKLIDKKGAEEILDSFQSKGIDWIERNSEREQVYSKKINSGDRIEIAKVANTLIRKKHEVEADGKKFYKNDNQLLKNIENILFKEMALALDTSVNNVSKKVNHIITKSQ